MTQVTENTNILLPQIKKSLQRIVDIEQSPFLVALILASHKYGYGQDAISIIEGNGHSIMTAACFWFGLTILNISEIQDTYSTNEKVMIVLLLSLIIEFAPAIIESIGTTPDLKDGIFIVITSFLLFYLEIFAKRVQKPIISRLVRSVFEGKDIN